MYYLYQIQPNLRAPTQKKVFYYELTLSLPPVILEPKKTPKLLSHRGVNIMNLFGDEKI